MAETGTFELPDTIEAIEFYYEQGLTDGLPVVPPTPERVQQFLDCAGLGPDEVLGTRPSRNWVVTASKVAVNAIMAGCLPEYAPVVIAAVRALLDPDFNAPAIVETASTSAPLLVINGPIRRLLDINCSWNLFGPGHRANATIGRAVRLVLMNACAAIPGLFDRSVIGHPGKYTYCIAEADTETHWTPLHVERGYSPDQSTVTVFAGESPRQVRAVGNPEAILYALADVASSLGSNMSTSGSVGDTDVGVRQGQIVVTIAGNSSLWKDWTKEHIRAYLHANIRRSVADLKNAQVLAGDVESGDAETFLPLIPEPEDILLIFAGGEESNMSSVIPSWGPKVACTAVTKEAR